MMIGDAVTLGVDDLSRSGVLILEGLALVFDPFRRKEKLVLGLRLKLLVEALRLNGAPSPGRKSWSTLRRLFRSLGSESESSVSDKALAAVLAWLEY